MSKQQLFVQLLAIRRQALAGETVLYIVDNTRNRTMVWNIWCKLNPLNTHDHALHMSMIGPGTIRFATSDECNRVQPTDLIKVVFDEAQEIENEITPSLSPKLDKETT